MLVLARKNHQKLLIGDDIVLTIVRSKHNEVRIGIEAPAHISILRAELQKYDKKEQKTN